jgi:hypothetical protein
MSDPRTFARFEFDPLRQRLVASFDSMRKVVFYGVPPDQAALLTDTHVVDEELTMHLLRDYAWAEIGAPPSYLGDTRR